MSCFVFTDPRDGSTRELPLVDTAVDPALFTLHPPHNLVRAVVQALRSLPGEHPKLIGIVGAAAAGKTTLANDISTALSAEGLTVAHVPGDDFTLPGEGTRYHQRDGYRDTLIHGPDIYDHQALLNQLHTLQTAGEHAFIITDSVCMGWHEPTAAALDLLIGLRLHDAERLRRKVLRDQDDPKREIDLIADFVEKQRFEVQHAVIPVLRQRADLIWDATANRMWKRAC